MSYTGHCKHGKYVGGCGIDWMCHECEMGEPDWTINELRSEIARSAVALEEGVGFYEGVFNGVGCYVTTDKIEVFTRDTRHRFTSLKRQLKLAVKWAKNDDDDDWLSTKHNADERAAYEYDKEYAA